MKTTKNFIIILTCIAFSTISCDEKDEVTKQENTAKIQYLKSELGGCNNKTIENIEVGDERNDTVIINVLNDTLNISVGFTYICCAPFKTDCSIKDDSIFISIIDTCSNPYHNCYCRCACYYTFDYFFNSLSNKNYYYQILLSDPREENDTIFNMGTMDVGE